MTDIFNPLKVFSDIATTRSWRFIYGSRAFLNWEITQQALSDGETFMALFPIVENGEPTGGLPQTSLYNTSVWIGRKFDVGTTLSTLDETEKQKYDRRLRELTYYMKEYILKNLFCTNSDMEVVSYRIVHELNQFSENVDAVSCELTIRIDWNYKNDINMITGSLIDIDGNVYPWVQIGSKQWMMENLKTTKYKDGTAIANITDAGLWAADAAGAYCAYDNSSVNASEYGMLYNWFAVDNSHRLAPDGWRVPTKADLDDLVSQVGSSPGGKLKKTGLTHWLTPNTGAVDTFGFQALGGGFRNDDGSFNVLKSAGLLWSSEEEYEDVQAYAMQLAYNNANAAIPSLALNLGCSVRCVRDV